MNRLALAAALSLLCLVERPAFATDERFVDRPLTLPPFEVSADIGVGVGQYEAFVTDPDNPQNTLSLGNRAGAGVSLQAAVGLPLVGELGLHGAFRFDSVGAFAQADSYGRLFDPIVNAPGTDLVANPEIFARRTLLAVSGFALALEARAAIPVASDSAFGLTLGLPMRVALPIPARIDAGLYVPVAWPSADQTSATFAIQAPLQVFFQVKDAFFGPMAGLLYTSAGGDPDPQIQAGFGGGYTFYGAFGVLDAKLQAYTTQINDVTWAKHAGFGAGVGLRTP